MKRILYIMCAAVAAAAMSSCVDREQGKIDFTTDISDFTIGPEGGIRRISITGDPDDSWSAVTGNEWILVSPATGKGSAVCSVKVDTTVLDQARTGKIDFTVDGKIKTLNITQDGFEKEITYNLEDGGEVMEIPDYAAYGENHFEVEVTANVPFNVVIPEEAASWLACRAYEQESAKYRPRTVKLVFDYEVNTKTVENVADIVLTPDGSESGEDMSGVADAAFTVRQAAAPEITDDRRGDSLAVIAIARDLGLYSSYDRSRPMDTWEGITLYTADDIREHPERWPDSYIGRLKSAEFFLFNTERSLPYEVQYLKTADSLAFISNGNNQQKSIDLGTEITNLENLRSLSLIAYGIASLPEEMVNMKGLEYLDISVNNLSAVPEFLRQENFPNMKYLMIKSNRRVDLRDLSNTTEDLNTIGLYTEFPEWLLEWSNLRSLVLSNNYFYGSIPDMEDYGERYSAEEASALGKPELEGTPKVLPNTTTFSINLNRLTGELPQWLLLHPNLARWDPYVAVFNQEGKDADGKLAGFDNVPNDIF